MESLLSLCLAGSPARLEQLWSAWSLAPATLGPLLLVALLYGAALIQQRRASSHSGAAKEAGVREASAFALGMILLALALVSPLCRMAATLAWAHMVQHVILVALAPPLLVLGAGPLRNMVRRTRRFGLGSLRSNIAARSIIVAALYGVAVWFWHIPAYYQAALLGTAEHLLMYASLLTIALLFWSNVLASMRERRQAAGVTVIVLLITMVHTGLLGALLTFSPTTWYPLMATGALSWGLAPLEDQQLAGLIMWIPMGFIYLFAGLMVAANALQTLTIGSEKRASGQPALRPQ